MGLLEAWTIIFTVGVPLILGIIVGIITTFGS